MAAKITKPEETENRAKQTEIKKPENANETARSGSIKSKDFVVKLKEELKGQSIPDSVFNAFVSITERYDKEENYRKIWNSTFLRPIKKENEEKKGS
ncbi:MAG: hypothetical protein JSU85_08720 [Candidatus Zixiibacteriota bacterium]|nr:MAG: hypothetical protein JSU85_08720 [candidate division Zixibacteria bacterium]